MKPLLISDAPTVILGLQDEIRRNPESRYNHRLHGLLLIAQGMSGLQVAQLLGGPRRLNAPQLQAVEVALRQSPLEQGLSTNLWDGKTLSTWIAQQFGVELRVRQFQ